MPPTLHYRRRKEPAAPRGQAPPAPESQLIQAPGPQVYLCSWHVGGHQCPGKQASGSESQWISPLPQLRRHYPSAPHFSNARHLTVICSMLPVQCLYFYSQVCGLSLCGRERGAGYFLLLCIFLLYWEGFHFLPNSQFCLSWAVQALRPPCPTPWSTREWRTEGSWLPPGPLPDDHLGAS